MHVSLETLKFCLYLAFSAACLVLGYAARRRNWLTENTSRPIHLITLVGFWSPVALVSFWRLDVDRQLLTVLLFQPAMLAWGGLLGFAIAKTLRLSPDRTGVVILCTALSNQGFTLGAYLCYALLGGDAMSYAITYTMSMNVCAVVMFYPIARHYGPEPNMPIARLIIKSLLDVRAMTLYASAAGLTLSACHVPVPNWLTSGPLLETLFYLGALGSYTAIGLRLHFGKRTARKREHAALAVAKFIGMPAAALAALWLLDAAGLPIADAPRDVLVISAFMPTAIIAVITSNLFHLDARFASALWLWNTAAFVVCALPYLLWSFR